MIKTIKVLLLSQRDVFNAGGLDFNNALNVIEKSICDYVDGKILYPSKVSQVFNVVTQDRINCLPASLLEEKVCGMKWVSVFPNNPYFYGIDNVNAVIILSSIETGLPLVFMEGSLCSNVRTASMNALAAKYLAKDNPSSIGFIGAGEQAKSTFLAIKSLYPDINICYVASRTNKTEVKFINTMKQLYPDVEFIECNSNYELAVSNSDIFVSAISGQSPIIKGEWIKKGQLYLHTGGYEDDYSVAIKADKIICDNWSSVKHRGSQTISKMYNDGIITDNDIYAEIDDIVSGKLEARKSNDEFIYFNAVGLSYVDIALANDIYVKALQKQLGTYFEIKNESMFDLL